MLEKLINPEKPIDYQKLYLNRGNNVEYDFSDYRSLKEFFKAIQEESDGVFGALKIYGARKTEYVKKKVF